MENPSFHRKKVRHFDEPGQFHELTFSCYQRLQLLTDDAWLSMLSESIDAATRRHGYFLTAFVYMPEHVHLLVFPQEKASGIDQLLKAIKRPFSYRIKRLLAQTGDPLLQTLTVHQRPGVHTFRFWQEGPGYDRNLLTSKATSAAINYIHLNPVRRGLAPSELDWRWSSAGCYADFCVEPDLGLPSVTMIDQILSY